MILSDKEKANLTNNHRVVLTRKWMGTGGLINWVMLNPSTADEIFDDPTIRKCIGFSKRWGFSELVVTNLFSFRATKPSDLRELVRCDYARAVGINDPHIIEQAHRANMVIAAWGIHGNLAGRADDVMNRVLPDIRMFCIGKTKDGLPLHPCMAGYTDAPMEFRR